MPIRGDEAAASEEAAFLARLQRRRDEMTSLVRARKRAPTSVRIQPDGDAARGTAVFPGSSFPSNRSSNEQLQREVVAARNTPVAANMRAKPPEFADIFSTARTVEDGFGRLSNSDSGTGASGSGIRLRPDPYAHRIRTRAGLALSCDGWGTQSTTLR